MENVTETNTTDNTSYISQQKLCARVSKQKAKPSIKLNQEAIENKAHQVI